MEEEEETEKEDEEKVVLFPDKDPPEIPDLYPIRMDRLLRERVEYAVLRFPNYLKHEAPRTFREKYPKPSLEGLLELGRLKGYWHPLEEARAGELLAKALSGEEREVS